MPSLIPGYEYDIFISYRQKDNQYDGWVTDFVNNLKKELEATLKNPVSVYFDKNPHDGLLETHNVDESLNKKLKCLVFIPILSQTYCDENCFAWQHELVPFLEMARDDRFSLNVPLANGNVASRVLPVQIHELDDADKDLFERTIGSKLRAIEFIYKEPGVNRSLNKSDNPEKNQNKTNYRNQINKVANALKEIGTALIMIEKGEKSSHVSSPTHEKAMSSPKIFRKKWLLGAVGLALIALVYFLYLQNSTSIKSDAISDLDKSIAVLAFENMSNDPEQEYFSDGISEEIINALTRVEGLRVAGRSSSFYFKGKDEEFKSIAEKLNVSLILEGSVRRSGDQLRITAQLIDAASGFHLWSENFDGTMDNVFQVQDQIAKIVSEKMELTLRGGGLNKKYIPKQAAYDMYLKGIFHWNKRGRELLKARDYFLEAVQIDSMYALAYAALSSTHALMLWYEVGSPEGIPELAHEYGTKAIGLDDDLAEGYAALGITYLFGYWDLEKAEELFAKGFELDPTYAPAAYWNSIALVFRGDYEKAEAFARNASKADPFSGVALANLSTALRRQGKYEEALRANNLALEIMPTENSYDNKEVTLIAMGQLDEALKVNEKAMEIFGRLPMFIAREAVGKKLKDRNSDISKYLDELNKLKETEFVGNNTLALVHYYNNELDSAKYFITRAIDKKETRLIYTLFDKGTEGDEGWIQFVRDQYNSPRATLR